MYPSRFLKADMLKGKKVTVTIIEIMGEDLIGENNKAKAEWIVKIKERPLQLVLNKTNGYCMYRMFGSDPHSWIGKRITLFPTTTKFGRDTLDCLRIWGSPDLAADMPITVPQGRKKAWETVMHAMGPAKTTASVTVTLDPRILTAFELLGWNDSECTAFLKTSTDQVELLAALNAKLDEMNAGEQ